MIRGGRQLALTFDLRIFADVIFDEVALEGEASRGSHRERSTAGAYAGTNRDVPRRRGKERQERDIVLQDQLGEEAGLVRNPHEGAVLRCDDVIVEELHAKVVPPSPLGDRGVRHFYAAERAENDRALHLTH